ncbi:MAG: 4Fe-4S dicluster domain-containing protein [Promethearchaeota archaeon]
MSIEPIKVLREELIESDVGTSLRVCYNCSTCATVCPVALETGGAFNPRTIIQLANSDYKDILIKRDKMDVFDCSCCENCVENCPQHVDLHETLIILKNLCALESSIPDSYTNETSQVYKFGKAIPLQPAIAKRRKQLGLPESPDIDAKEIQTLMDLTPVKIVFKRKEEQKAAELKSEFEEDKNKEA